MFTATAGRSQHPRKACDLCFAKKIKCNMFKPDCSNCILYETECHTSIFRRRADLPKLKPAAKSTADAQGNSNKVNKRLEGIEKQLQRVIESTELAHTPASAVLASPSNVPQGSSFQNACSGSLLWRFDPINPSLYYGDPDEHLLLSLPPLHDILPMIDHYFGTCNKIVPLFSEATFMRLVTGWYNKHPRREKATWAAILVVIALGLRSPTLNFDPGKKSEWESYCMRNSQSVMSELVTREQDLLGIQVLLALIMLFYNSSDAKPANILIGTAMRISQRFQLQLNASAQHYTAEEAQQRSKVFWIAYIFDKDISLRTKTPSVQYNGDIDIPLPLNETSLISTSDGRSQLEFFRLRLDLAHIEGRIYDLLYSSRSAKIQGNDRRSRVAGLQVMLDSWYARIPAAFQLDKVSTTVSDANMLEMITGLFHTYLICITSTHGVYSAQAEWLQRVGSLSRVAIDDFAVAMHGPRVTTFMQNQDPPLANAWDHCVDISRGSMKLFQDASPSEGLIWQCSCAHFTSLIVLLANIVIYPAHESTSLDLRTATQSMSLFEQLVDVTQSLAYEPLLRIIKDLYTSATAVASNRQLDQLDQLNGENILDPTTCSQENDAGIFCEGTTLSEFEWDDSELGGPDFDALFEPFRKN